MIMLNRPNAKLVNDNKSEAAFLLSGEGCV